MSATTVIVPKLFKRPDGLGDFSIIATTGTYFNLNTGSGINKGGSFNIYAGTSSGAPGGSVYINSGIGPVTGGNLIFNAGTVQTGIQGSIYSSGYSVNKGYSNILTVQSAAVGIWTQTAIMSVNWYSVCWSPFLNLFCAVNSSNNNILIISPNGINWTSIVFSLSNYVMASVVWSNKLSIFCALSANAGISFTSPNGTSWTSSAMGAVSCDGSVFSEELCLFLTCGYNDTGVAMSNDGIIWTSSVIPYPASQGICWSPDLMKFCILSIDNSYSMLSSDGINWTAHNFTTSANWISVCWSSELYMFCSVAYTIFAGIIHSANGINWISENITNAAEYYQICWSPQLSLFCAITSTLNTGYALVSSNGVNWTSRAVVNGYCECWSPELNIFCVCRNGAIYISNNKFLNYNKQVNIGTRGTNSTTVIQGNEIIMGSNANTVDIGSYSDQIILNSDVTVNGELNVEPFEFKLGSITEISNANSKNVQTSILTTWNTGTTINAYVWHDMCWSPELGLFCAVARYAVSTGRIIRSSDGITWYSATSGTDSNSWMRVCWSSGLKMFCAVSDTDKITTSFDAITWTTRLVRSGTYHALCWSEEIAIYVALTFGSGFLITSPDGINWTSSTISISNWISICWSSDLYMFCGVNANSNSDIIWSTNGTTWYTNGTGIQNNWACVCWSPELMLFCAAGSSNIVMTSPSGKDTWTYRYPPSTSNNWTSICWSPQLSLFCACGTASNKIITSTNGINWTVYTVPSSVLRSICWSPSLSMFCAMSESGGLSVSSNTNFSQFSTQLTMGTPVTCNVNLKGNDIIIGSKASIIEIGKYAQSVYIGDVLFTRKYYYKGIMQSTNSAYTGPMLFTSSIQSNMPQPSDTSYVSGKYGYYINMAGSNPQFYAPVSSMYLFLINAFSNTANPSDVVATKNGSEIFLTSYADANSTVTNISTGGAVYLNVGDNVYITCTNIYINGIAAYLSIMTV